MEIYVSKPRVTFSFVVLLSDVENEEVRDLLNPIRKQEEVKVKTYDRDGGVQALIFIDKWLQTNKVTLPSSIKVDDCRLYEVSVPIDDASTIQHLVEGRHSSVVA